MSTRKFSRVNFRIAATVSATIGQFQGEVQNLSLNGMFLSTGEQLPVGTPAEIRISLSGIDPEISVQVAATVSRVTGDGIAFTFDKTDLDSYTHLKNIVSYNTDDADQIIEEMKNSIDEKFAGTQPVELPTRTTTP